MFGRTKAFKSLLGEDALFGSSLAVEDTVDDDTIHFLVTDTKQTNYKKHCDRIESSINGDGIINRYTDHPTQYYAKVNLALAADSNSLYDYKDYIPQLKSAILSKPLLDDGIVYRGVDLSPQEIEHMEKLNNFFIPSFTSTSIDSTKAYDKPALMVIKIPYGCLYACSITSNLSKYYNEEREVLLSCYSAFRLERIEHVNNKKIITLYLDEHLSALPHLS